MDDQFSSLATQLSELQAQLVAAHYAVVADLRTAGGRSHQAGEVERLSNNSQEANEEGKKEELARVTQVEDVNRRLRLPSVVHFADQGALVSERNSEEFAPRPTFSLRQPMHPHRSATTMTVDSVDHYRSTRGGRRLLMLQPHWASMFDTQTRASEVMSEFTSSHLFKPPQRRSFASEWRSHSGLLLQDLAHQKQRCICLRQCDPRRYLPLNPQSRLRLVWDVFAMVILAYDIVTMPLILLVLPEDSLKSGFDIFTSVFWSTDILLSFLTATFVECELKTSFRDIARRYMKTWFVADFLLVSLDWVTLAVQTALSSLTAFRVVRVLRTVRLLRLFKVEGLLREQLQRLNSAILLNMVRLVQVILALLLVAHYMACLWYWIGQSPGGWIQSIEHPEQLLYCYTTALHWALTNFHGGMEVNPGNITERSFAIGMLFTGLLVFSIFVAVTTDMILQIRLSYNHLNRRKRMLQEYFMRHHIPTELMVGVKKYFQHEVDVSEDWVEDTQLLQALPVAMQRSVLQEVRTPTLKAHRLFAFVEYENAAAMREICHAAVKTIRTTAGQTIFSYGDACHHMYFVESGAVRYLRLEQQPALARLQGLRRTTQVAQAALMRVGTKLTKLQWVCEPAIWLQDWRNVGDLVGSGAGTLLAVESTNFAKTVGTFVSVHDKLVIFARAYLMQMASLYEHSNDEEAVVNDLFTLNLDDAHSVSDFASVRDRESRLTSLASVSVAPDFAFRPQQADSAEVLGRTSSAEDSTGSGTFSMSPRTSGEAVFGRSPSQLSV